jgi:tetratricopeptide (TPR) repeat protein
MSETGSKLYNAAIDAIQTNQLPKALSHVENALTEDPKDTSYWQLYVRLLNAMGRTDDANKAITKLKGLGLSELDEILINAALCIASEDIDGAISNYDAAIAIEPKNSEIHSSRAMALFHKGDQEAALTAAEKAVELDPGESRANYALGHILRLMGRKDEALEALNKAVAAEPELMAAVYEQGMLLAESGQLEEALSNFEKFVKLHPDDPNALQAIEAVKTALRKTDTF